MHKPCNHCGEEFWASLPHAKYCGAGCRQDAFVERRRNGELEERDDPSGKFDPELAASLAARLGRVGLM